MLGHRPLIVDKRHRLGGLQLDSPYPNNWIVGVRDLTGEQLALAIHEHIVAEGIAHQLNTEVVDIERTQNGFRLTVTCRGNTQHLEGATVVIASGVRAATGGLAAARDVIFGPGTAVASTDFAGKTVAILGGGDNAFENYLFVKERGARVAHIFARTVVARQEFLDQVPADDVLTGHYEASPDDRSVNGRQYDRLLVFYGWKAELPFLATLAVSLDPKGFVVTGEHCETSVDGLFAVGEVANRMHPCVVTAMADGVTAAKTIQRRLEQGVGSRFTAMAKRAWGALKASRKAPRRS